jgi:aspartoacylase
LIVVRIGQGVEVLSFRRFTPACRLFCVNLPTGTHGNETTGVFALSRFRSNPELLARDGIEVEYALANPKAVAETRRFCDDDLNRQYSLSALRAEDSAAYEAARARLMELRFGPRSSDSPRADFLIDMHSTTSRMGVTLIFESEGIDAATLFVCAYVQRELASRIEAPVFVLFASMPYDTIPHTPSLARSGIAVEVGPIAQGLLREDVSRWNELTVITIMDALHAFNTGTPTTVHGPLTVFRNMRTKIPCPADADGTPTAVFHEDLQDHDYALLRKGDPMFRCVDGSIVSYDGTHGDVVVPVFVNEAAYYLPQSGLGFAIGKRVTADLPQLVASADGVSRSSLPVPEPDSDEHTVAALEGADPWAEAAAAFKTAKSSS